MCQMIPVYNFKNNKHQIKISAHFVFSPICEYIVLVYPTGLDFFTQK